jgi:hypothetical protein
MQDFHNANGKPNIARGYAATKADREALARDAGLPVASIRCAEVEKEAFPQPTWGLRKGKLLAVRSIADLGADRWAIADAVEWVRAFGADVIEVPVGRVAGAGVAMLNDALSRIHGKQRKMTSEEAKAKAEARHAEKRKARMPKAQVIKIWRASRYKRYEDALKHMPGWNKMSAYKELGPRNTGTGRPRKS